MDSSIEFFTKGVHNLLNNEEIPEDAAQDSLGFVTQDGRLKLVGGRKIIGADGAVGAVRGMWTAFKKDGTQLIYRKIETKIQLLQAGVWVDVITGLTSGSEYTAANYSSLAGAFILFAGTDGIYKVNTANPTSALSMYDVARNDKGKIIINKGRTTMWDCANASKTTLKQSWIDSQDATVYTTVAAEVLGASPTQLFTGTLAFKTATRNCFGLVVTGTTGGTAETFTDNGLGVLTSNKGGTGTINYTTGVYSINFSAALSAGNCTVAYQWEDSNQKGVTDFTFTVPTRVPSEGNRITQDFGGDPIQSVYVGQDGAYYSIKSINSYKLLISADDKTFTNDIYYANLGMPYFRAGVSTSKGIIFMNTANPDKPEMTQLVKNQIGDALIPVTLFPHFKFSNYSFADCFLDTYERFIVIGCKKVASDNNDTLLLCNVEEGSVTPQPYAARMSTKDSSANYYIGSPVAETVSQVFNGFDDDGLAIQNWWISKASKYGALKTRSLKWRIIQELLKKFRKIRIKGLIDPNQVVEIWASYDDAGYQKVGTLRGSASYVDYSQPQAIGSNYIGQVQIGGDDVTNAYPYFAEIKVHPTKFRKRTIKLVATGIGYFDVNFLSDWDIVLYEARIPKRFRQKQKVSLDGTLTDQN